MHAQTDVAGRRPGLSSASGVFSAPRVERSVPAPSRSWTTCTTWGPRSWLRSCSSRPQGNILMNSDYESSVPVIQASVEKLGFKFSDIKILIAGHAHPDHVGGDDLVKELTGAQVVVGRVDAPQDQGVSPARQGAPDRPAGRRWRHGHARRNDPDGPPDARPHQGMPRLEHES